MLRVGEQLVRVDPSLFELLQKRCRIDSFVSKEAGSVALRVSRASALGPAQTPITGSPAPWGSIELSGDELRANVPDDPFAAESVLRAAFHLIVSRGGGFLIHASGVALGGQALVALGPSGAGKSTFARLTSTAPGAQLLSDEIVAVFADGTVHGTPFRSDSTEPASPSRFPLASLFVLEKGDHEEVEAVPPQTAMTALLSQSYHAPLEPLPRAELLKRAASVVSAAGLRRLTFRKDPAVAEFLSRWVDERRRDP